MHPDVKECIKTVMLENMVDRSLPRIMSIKKKLETGYVLLDSELEFFQEVLVEVSFCERGFLDDQDCKEIFASIAHLVRQVLDSAMDNELKYQPEINWDRDR